MKKRKVYLMIGIMVSVGLIIGITYAYIMLNFNQTNSNVVNTECFNITFQEGNAINLPNAYPISDSDGLETDLYTFTITNNCSSYANYTINLEILNTSTLPDKYVAVSLDNTTKNILTSYSTVTKTLSDATTSYQLKTGYLNQNESQTYNLRLWMDESVTMADTDSMNKVFVSKITVSTSYRASDPTYEEVLAHDYGDKALSTTIASLAKTDTTNLAYDETTDNNLRYIGANPNNYVTFNNELWRIIGVMNNMDNGTGNKYSMVKLIRNESIGSYSWDSSASDVNSGAGVNEWSQADLMTELNVTYYNKKSGICYNNWNNATTTCDFTTIGLTTIAQSMISNVIWNTGAISWSAATASNLYINERGTTNGKICTSSTATSDGKYYCTDTADRTSSWSGKIGLMYPSDYVYATNGGNIDSRTACLTNHAWDYWTNASHKDCYVNDWLYQISNTWLLSSLMDSARATSVCGAHLTGGVYNDRSGYARSVRPSLYLNPTIKVTNGEGSSTNPYILSL